MKFQITFDAESPKRLSEFWKVALGYVDQPPPEGFDTWDEALDAFGIDHSDPDGASAIVEPSGNGPRLFFLRVPEGKSSKNRMHLDVEVGEIPLLTRAQELVAFGASMGSEFDRPEGHWITMTDPEGNEFCLH